jgi:hypothetical protein
MGDLQRHCGGQARQAERVPDGFVEVVVECHLEPAAERRLELHELLV